MPTLSNRCDIQLYIYIYTLLFNIYKKCLNKYIYIYINIFYMCGFEASTPDALSLPFCGFDPGLSVPVIKFLGQPEGSCFTSVTRM